MNTILCPHKANSDNIFCRPKGKKMYAYNKIYLTESPCGKGVISKRKIQWLLHKETTGKRTSLVDYYLTSIESNLTSLQMEILIRKWYKISDRLLKFLC